MKLIVNRRRCMCINVENIKGLQIGTHPNSGKPVIAAGMQMEDDVIIGTYETREEAEKAFFSLMWDLEHKDICYINQSTADNAPA